MPPRTEVKLTDEKQQEIEVQKKYASNQIRASIEYNVYTSTFTFSLTGRPPTKLPNGAQGDHVTAFALVKRGLLRHLTDIVVENEKDLHKVQAIRNKKILNGYLAKLLVAFPDTLEPFKATIPEIFNSYDAQRSSKTKLEEIKTYLSSSETEARHNALSLIIEKFVSDNSIEVKASALQTMQKDLSAIIFPPPRIADLINENVKKSLVANARFMCSQICEISRSFLTYYNKMPRVAFEKIEGYEAPKDEGAKVKDALEFLDEHHEEVLQYRSKITEIESDLKEIDSQLRFVEPFLAKNFIEESDIKALDEWLGTQRSFVTLKIEVIKSTRSKRQKKNILKDWVVQVNQVVLQRKDILAEYATAKTIAEKISDLFFYPYIREKEKLQDTGRTNDLNDFYEAMARHLYITFAAYEDLLSEKDKIIQSVVHNSIVGGGWQKLLNSDTKVTAAVNQVTLNYDTLTDRYAKSEKFIRDPDIERRLSSGYQTGASDSEATPDDVIAESDEILSLSKLGGPK